MKPNALKPCVSYLGADCVLSPTIFELLTDDAAKPAKRPRPVVSALFFFDMSSSSLERSDFLGALE